MFFFLFIQYVSFFVNLSFNKSLPNILTIKLIGVTTIKKTKAIIIGAMIFPNISPNLIQALFKGLKSFGKIKAKNKNNKAKLNDQTLIGF